MKATYMWHMLMFAREIPQKNVSVTNSHQINTTFCIAFASFVLCVKDHLKLP